MRTSIILFASLGTTFCHAAAISRANHPDRIIASHEALLFGRDGRVEIWNKTEIASFDWSVPETPPTTTALRKRDSSTIIIPNADQTFLGWDIALSQVIKAPANSKATVAVMAGSSVANTVTVTAGSTLTLVKDFLETSLSISYATTWTSTDSVTNSFQIDEGKYGCIVSNPLTLRKSGSVFSGRIGSEGGLSTYQADSFTDKTYKDMNWVAGVMTTCQGDTYPMNRCLGEGTLE